MQKHRIKRGQETGTKNVGKDGEPWWVDGRSKMLVAFAGFVSDGGANGDDGDDDEDEYGEDDEDGDGDGDGEHLSRLEPLGKQESGVSCSNTPA